MFGLRQISKTMGVTLAVTNSYNLINTHRLEGKFERAIRCLTHFSIQIYIRHVYTIQLSQLRIQNSLFKNSPMV